ncbi:MAG TPA: hypothetical protein K8V00_04730 [Ligilactobacillus acidipiscis]|uniref:Uncharacterized protein n=1 Tax=Ligilactobacillus acidipiscis TaxID=89059 RepID=A0A921K0T5_9LACO|nr:hypothetical protein [Ligilactobacillus acidipiscis]
MHKSNILLNEKGIRKIYHEAFQDDQALITPTTTMIIDTHKLGLPNCQAILLDKKRGTIFTKRSTNMLVKKFISWQNFNFVLSTFIIGELYHDHSHRHIVPFVSGNQILLPTRGYVHSPASWIVQSNLIDYCCLGHNEVGLQFSKHHGPEYILPVNSQQFTTIYANALIIAEVQTRMIEQLIKDFPCKFIKDTHNKIREFFPQQLPENISLHKITEYFIDKIIEDVLQYSFSLIDEEPDEKYILQVKNAVKEHQKRLR